MKRTKQREIQKELRQIDIGDKMEQKLFNRINLEFEQRLNNFKSLDEFDQDVGNWLVKFLNFYGISNNEVFSKLAISEQDPYSSDYDSETIGMEKYISFSR
jgi:hypothetical protein